ELLEHRIAFLPGSSTYPYPLSSMNPELHNFMMILLNSFGVYAFLYGGAVRDYMHHYRFGISVAPNDLDLLIYVSSAKQVNALCAFLLKNGAKRNHHLEEIILFQWHTTDFRGQQVQLDIKIADKSIKEEVKSRDLTENAFFLDVF